MKNDLRSYMKADPKGAILSSIRRHRYALWRVFDPAKGIVNFVGLNPSTADESTDDMTIRRCMRFASDWGYGGLLMTNLFAFRSTYPSELSKASDPVGPQNDRWLSEAVSISNVVVCCWGNLHLAAGSLFRRPYTVMGLIAKMDTPIFCLGVTKAGSPRHPSRIAASTRLKPYVV